MRPARLEDRGEEAPTPLRDGQVRPSGLGSEHPEAVPVAFVGAIVTAFITLGLDQLLSDETDRFSDQIEVFPRSEGGEHLGEYRLLKGHRCVLLWCVRTGTHRGSRRWPLYGWTLGPHFKTHDSGGRCLLRPLLHRTWWQDYRSWPTRDWPGMQSSARPNRCWGMALPAGASPTCSDHDRLRSSVGQRGRK